MKTINNDNRHEIVVKKSKFIAYLYKVQNIEEVNKYLDQIKKEYSDATHICYAYVIDNTQKFSDDNEPSGTAGKPILNVLTKNNLNFCLAIVIRYFGGIKLGANGLIRAYSKGIIECLKENQIIELEKGFLIKIIVSYDQQKLLTNLIKDYQIKETIFDQSLTYIVESDRKLLNTLKLNNLSYEVIKDIYIKKKEI